MYSGITRSSKIYTLTSLGMQVIHDCNVNPPLDEEGRRMNTMLPHDHVGVLELDLYKEVTVGRSSNHLNIVDWRN